MLRGENGPTLSGWFVDLKEITFGSRCIVNDIIFWRKLFRWWFEMWREGSRESRATDPLSCAQSNSNWWPRVSLYDDVVIERWAAIVKLLESESWQHRDDEGFESSWAAGASEQLFLSTVRTLKFIDLGSIKWYGFRQRMMCSQLLVEVKDLWCWS
jgi:hypothetical protein